MTTAYRILAADMDEPLVRTDTATDAIDALLVEAYFSVAFATTLDHSLCDHPAECTVESDARMVEGLDRGALLAELDASGHVSLFLDSYEWGFSASLTAERIDANAEAGQ